MEPASLKPGYLPCPNCGATLPEAAINDHLDRCVCQAAAGWSFQDVLISLAPVEDPGADGIGWV